jgi:hypothetical protein
MQQRGREKTALHRPQGSSSALPYHAACSGLRRRFSREGINTDVLNTSKCRAPRSRQGPFVARGRDYQEFRAEVGHDRSKGAQRCRAAKNLAYPTLSSTSCWRGADPKTVFDPNGLLDDLKKALAERVLSAEMDHHLAGEEPDNRRNGYGKKTVITASFG